MSEPTVPLSLRVPPEFKERLAKIADERDTTMTAVIIEALDHLVMAEQKR